MFDRGQQYEDYVGRWSRRIAPLFVDWLGVRAGASWLDAGCGTGALTQAVLERAEPASVMGIDPSEGYVAHARTRLADPRASFEVADAQSLPARFADFDAVVSGLVLNFIPDQPAALLEMSRVSKPGAVVAAYVWDYAEGMQMMRHFWDAAGALDAGAVALDEGRKFSVCTPDGLRELFSRTLADVQVDGFTVPAWFASFDDYWQPFLGGQGPAGTYLVGLGESDRERLREAVLLRLPVAPDGSIELSLRAWAVKARKP